MAGTKVFYLSSFLIQIFTPEDVSVRDPWHFISLVSCCYQARSFLIRPPALFAPSNPESYRRPILANTVLEWLEQTIMLLSLDYQWIYKFIQLKGLVQFTAQTLNLRYHSNFPKLSWKCIDCILLSLSLALTMLLIVSRWLTRCHQDLCLVSLTLRHQSTNQEPDWASRITSIGPSFVMWTSCGIVNKTLKYNKQPGCVGIRFVVTVMKWKPLKHQTVQFCYIK